MSEIEEDSDFLELVARLGADSSLAQGLGGNCSIKEAGSLRVKASGMRLSSVNNPNYFYSVGLDGNSYKDTIQNQLGKPSIEVFLHALLTQKFVLHLHSTRSLALGLLKTQQDLSVFKEVGMRIALVDYWKPGEQLRDSIFGHPMFNIANVFLLKNHGIVFGADSVAEMSKMVESFEVMAADLLGGRPQQLCPSRLDESISPADSNLAFWHAENNWAISPDHVLFLGAVPDPNLMLRLRFARTTGALVERTHPSNLTIADEQVVWFFNVARLLPRKHLSQLNATEVNEIVNWDLEKHRQEAAVNLNTEGH